MTGGNLGKQKTRSLYFSNRKEYYRRKRISASLKRYYSNRKILKEKIETEKGLFRHSLAYYNHKYDKTLRAEFLSESSDKERAKRRLIAFLDKVLEKRKSLRKLFSTSSVLGLESERVGENDIQGEAIETMSFGVS